MAQKPAHGRYLRGGMDRAVFLARAFGRGGDDEIMETLRAMRKTVRPGGLLCFHIFDRDRAWSLVGERSFEDGGGAAKVRLGFQPETGRITARVVMAKDRVGERPSGTGSAHGIQGKQDLSIADTGGRGTGGQSSVKAWNLGEIRILLRSAGLHLERAYGDWDGGSPEAAGAATGRLIIVAARPRLARKGSVP